MRTSSYHLTRECFSDASAQETALRGWQQRYSQLRPGLFAGEVQTLNLPGISITRERVNLAVAQEIANPAGTVVLVSSLSCSAEWRVNAVRRGTDVISLYRGGTEVTAVAPDNSDVLIVVVDARLLGIAAEDIPPARNAIGSAQTEATKQWLASMLAIYGMNDAPPELDALLPGLVLDRMRAMLQHFPLSRDTALRPRAAYALYRQAVRLLEDQDRAPLSIADLALELGVPTASLHEAFTETTGVTPGTWLRQHRLDGARRDLTRSGGNGSVSEIAMKWGFWHLGRFSAYYAQRFGHTPSDALRART
ncbi:helix-turn-helix domain-containing protein [Devosia sp. CN2-171]|uniref:helix-turn-helix domain-containing protein n=1 Tax=Devosia sp. CN2-171 TaxID=3400909 RepID=UPI003BF87109